MLGSDNRARGWMRPPLLMLLLSLGIQRCGSVEPQGTRVASNPEQLGRLRTEDG